MTLVTNFINNRALVTGSLLLLGGLSIYYFTSKANNNNNEKGSKERGVSGLPDENQSHKAEKPDVKDDPATAPSSNLTTHNEPAITISNTNTKDEPASRSIETQPVNIAVTSTKEESVVTTEITQKEPDCDIHVTEIEKESIAVTELVKEEHVDAVEMVKQEAIIDTVITEAENESVTIVTDDKQAIEIGNKEETTEHKEDVTEKMATADIKEEEMTVIETDEAKEEFAIELISKEEAMDDKTPELSTGIPEKTGPTEEEVLSLSVTDVPTATIDEPADTPYAASSGDENDIGTPENEPASMPTFRSYDDIPEFIPQQKPRKRSSKKSLTRIQLIEQQRQNHTPTVNARCNHWPRCTNKHCKYWHPFKMCRAGDACYYGKKCMFVHPSDYLEQPEKKDSSENVQQYF